MNDDAPMPHPVIPGDSRDDQRQALARDLLLPNQNKHITPVRRKHLVHVDCRLSALKALALTLLTGIESLEAGDPEDSSDLDLQTEVRRFEAELIRSALITTGGRQRRAARLLGMKVTTLNGKIKRYMIDVPLAR